MITQIEESHKLFISSRKTLEDFFSVSIIYANQCDGENFNIKPIKLKFDRAIIIFGGATKHKDEHYLGKDFQKLYSNSPIQIKAETLFSLLGKPPLGNKPIEHSNCTIYKLKNTKDQNGARVIRGHKHYSIPGGDDNNEIKVGVWEWNYNEENVLFWLPSENLIENVYRCTKTPTCNYSTPRPQV